MRTSKARGKTANVSHARWGVLATILTILVALGVAVPAWAISVAPVVPSAAADQVYIKKELVTLKDDANNYDSTTFTFKVEKVSLNDLKDDATLAKMPTIADVSFPGSDMSVDSGASTATTTVKTHTVQLGLDATDVVWSTPGTYVYKVTETTGTAADLSYANDVYLVRVYVGDDSSSGTGTQVLGVTVDGVTVEHTEGSSTAAGKTDGTLTFRNVENKGTAGLTIRKEIEGSLADYDRKFDFTITLTTPNTVTESDTTSYTAIVHHNGASDEDVILTKADDYVAGTKQTWTIANGFKLSHGSQIVFDNLPVGTTYTYTEAGVSGYKTRASTTTTGLTGDNAVLTNGTAGGADGAGITVAYGDTNKAAIVGSNSTENESVVTNSYLDVTPTGIALTVLPYVVMVGLPVAAVVAYVAIKRRATRA